MTNKLKTFSLAMLAALAATALAASAAQAEPVLTAASYPALLTGEQQETIAWGWEDGLKTTCNELAVQGELEEPSTTFQLAAVFAECTLSGLTVSPVEMNGCGFHFQLTEEQAEDAFLGDASLVCPEGEKVVVTWLNCEIQVPAQIVKEGATFVNQTGSGDVALRLELSGITFEKTKDPVGCALTGLGYNNTGTLTGEVLLDAEIPESGEGIEIAVQ